ncbi:hypothetical protein KCU77_g12025, partial [Aureobasidium melanogenum]
MYPPAYLGDFGLAFTTRLGDERSSEAGGAFGWWPPEHHTTEHYHGHSSSSTNVWQIGFLILCAINGITDPDQPNADAVLRYDDDDMQRWGTKTWITTKHNETSEDDGPYHHAVALAEAEEEEDEQEEEEKEEEDDPVEDEDLILPAIHRKRKSTYPSPTPKRLKGTSTVSREILQRRYALVAKQMKLGKTSQILDAHADDKDFLLADGYKLKHYRDEEFDPETFFSSPDPGPIKHMTVAEPEPEAEDDAMPGSTTAEDDSTPGFTFKFAKRKDVP